MTRRERLMATMRGEPVDRPAVSFYEIDGLRQDESRADPSWKPALKLARERTDRIVMTGVGFKGTPPDPLAELTTTETWEADGSRFTKRTIRAGEDRGFVLMPSACPIGRELSERALGNYEKMVEFVERL